MQLHTNEMLISRKGKKDNLNKSIFVSSTYPKHEMQLKTSGMFTSGNAKPGANKTKRFGAANFRKSNGHPKRKLIKKTPTIKDLSKYGTGLYSGVCTV